MEQFLNHFQEYLILGLLLTLFFKEALADYIQGKLGLEKKKEKVPEWGKTLTQYANHDTTERLELVLSETRGIKDTLRDHNKLDERIIVLLEEQKEYGVKIRKE